MPIKSVDNPRVRRAILESLELPAVVRDVRPAIAGSEPDHPSRAAAQFLVHGTRDAPPRRRSMLESLLEAVDRRQQILETELTPWRMICALDIESQNGPALIGTGWFVGPRTVITAGHCVFDPVELGGWAKKITVTPGRNGSALPFPSEASAEFSTTDLWQKDQNPDFDYGVIHLKTYLGAKVGAFGVAVLPDAELQNRLVNVSGYPTEPGDGQLQYFHASRVKATTGRRVFYDVDTVGGQSGSPVWAYLDDSKDPIVVAIHAYGIGGVPAGLSVVANSGPRIIPEVLDVIRGWAGADVKT
jgi:V8-like Glu-specific endopeptidase